MDLYLAPFYFKFPNMQHAYLIELKYISRGKDTLQRRKTLLHKARSQLQRYAGAAQPPHAGAMCLNAYATMTQPASAKNP